MPKTKSQHQGVDGVFYLVNPHGAIHDCTRDHAATRLRQVGWRLAEDNEIAVYKEQTVQRYQRPICEPWSPEPEDLIELPPEKPPSTVQVTDTARKMAEANGVDLAKITGTGKNGTILVSDVEAVIE